MVLAASTALLTPIMVHHLGAVDYGVWVLASSILDYYGLLDLGMRSAMFRYVSLFRGGSQREEVDRTFSSALLLVIGTAVLICMLSIGMAYLLPRFTHVDAITPRMYSWLLFLLGTSVAVMFPTRMLATYISAHNRWDLYNAAGIANTVTRAIILVVVLKLGYGILAVAVATLVVAFASLGQHIVFLFIADPRAQVNFHLVTLRRMRELFGFSMRSLLVSLGDYLRFYSDSAVIASVLGVGFVTPFNIATRLIECFKSVVVAAGGPVLGAMTELDGGRRQKDLQALLLRSTRLLALLSILGGVLLLADGRMLLHLWVGEELVSAYAIVAVLAFGYMINLTQHAALLIVISKGQHGPLGWWTIAEGIANIVLSVIWGRSYGLIGIAVGTVVPMMVVKVLIQLRYALRAADLSARDYLRGGLGRALVVGVLFFAVAAKLALRADLTFASFAGTVLVQLAVFLASTWFFGLTRMERQWLTGYARQHLRWPALRRSPELDSPSSKADLFMKATQTMPSKEAHSQQATSAPTISVIIPTKNRARDLQRALDSVMIQTRRPDEIIVLDQGSNPALESPAFPIPLTYIYAPYLSGLTVARNAATDRAKGDIWVFLDDDVILEPEYLEELLRAYSPEVTGVSGIFTNYTIPPLLRRLFEKVFVRGAFHDDRQPIYWHANRLRERGLQRVKQFTGAAMSFRASAVRALRFDTNLTGASIAEDIDFCARLPRSAVLVIAPKARLFHKRSAIGRATAHWLDEHAQSSAYMRRRNWNRGLGDDLCFAWLQTGYGVMAAIGSVKRGSFEPFRSWRRGRARGYKLASPNVKPSDSGVASFA